MAKGPKTSAKEDDASSKMSKSSVNDSIPPYIEPAVEEEHPYEVEGVETKSVAESDSGKVLSVTASIGKAGSDYSEPSLANIIITQYEGSKSKKGQFEGYGEALFVGGNSYKGFFQNGVMHGKGKYEWADGSFYDGDMNNNQISGYGRYEWADESYYEGEVSNGMRHGVGVFKSPKHNVSYSGQWYLGKRHGRGIMHYSEHSWYEGDWVNNTRHGWGVRRYHTGNVYEGQWINDKRHGEGTMRWLTTDESFSGMWENGVQHGGGTHTWYLNRVPGSQYPLRNEYVGDFVNGLRHGHGKFFFASGAVYDGEWENNQKHGWGKFIFKNGRIFEGQFENDHMVNYPNFRLDGSTEIDGGSVRTRTPVGWEEADNEAAKNRANLLGPSLNLDIDFILDEFPEEQRELELSHVTSLILRNVTILRRVYSFYSALGHDKSPDNTFVMTRFQFWRFLKDCHIHHHNKSLSEMDRTMARCHDTREVHNPMEKLLLREFLTTCVGLSYEIYKEEEKAKDIKKTGVLSRCVQRLLDDHIMKHSCRVGGYFLSEPRHAVCALAYMDRSWHIYQRVCTRRRRPPYEMSFTMRKFLLLLKDLRIIGSHLSTKAVMEILCADDPSVSDESFCNLEVEMTFLEFFEALIGIAVQHMSNDLLQQCVMNEKQPPDTEHGDKPSRPLSSATQSVSEYPGNPLMSTETFSQLEEDKCGNVQSKQSFGSNPAGELMGGFLQTLSQMSIQEDSSQAPDDTTSIKQEDSGDTQPQTEPESNPEEDEFNIWSSKLDKFFSQLLFPLWNYQETVRAQVNKDKLEQEEQDRIQEVEKEAEKRRQLVNEEIPPTVEELAGQDPLLLGSTETLLECGSAGPEYQVLERKDSVLPLRPTSSVTSSVTPKSGKKRRR